MLAFILTSLITIYGIEQVFSGDDNQTGGMNYDAATRQIEEILGDINDGTIPDTLAAFYQAYNYTTLAKKILETKVDRKDVPAENWYKVCNTTHNMVTLMDWENDDIKDAEQDVIFIKWPNGRTECYDANNIKRTLKQESSIAVDWIQNPLVNMNSISSSEQAQGLGYYPDAMGTLYMKIWPLNNYITIKSLAMMFKSKNRYFNAVAGGEKRLGNMLGSRGVSRLHGQLPLEKVFNLVPVQDVNDFNIYYSDSDDSYDSEDDSDDDTEDDSDDDDEDDSDDDDEDDSEDEIEGQRFRGMRTRRGALDQESGPRTVVDDDNLEIWDGDDNGDDDSDDDSDYDSDDDSVDDSTISSIDPYDVAETNAVRATSYDPEVILEESEEESEEEPDFIEESEDEQQFTSGW
jgi:hypothetical protein